MHHINVAYSKKFPIIQLDCKNSFLILWFKVSNFVVQANFFAKVNFDYKTLERTFVKRGLSTKFNFG